VGSPFGAIGSIFALYFTIIPAASSAVSPVEFAGVILAWAGNAESKLTAKATEVATASLRSFIPKGYAEFL
jgi:hypothetical protein